MACREVPTFVWGGRLEIGVWTGATIVVAVGAGIGASRIGVPVGSLWLVADAGASACRRSKNPGRS